MVGRLFKALLTHHIHLIQSLNALITDLSERGAEAWDLAEEDQRAYQPAQRIVEKAKR